MNKKLEKYIEALKKLGILKEKLNGNKEGVKDIEKVIAAVVREMSLIKKI